jgi:hypothetical protein
VRKNKKATGVAVALREDLSGMDQRIRSGTRSRKTSRAQHGLTDRYRSAVIRRVTGKNVFMRESSDMQSDLSMTSAFIELRPSLNGVASTLKSGARNAAHCRQGNFSGSEGFGMVSPRLQISL